MRSRQLWFLALSACTASSAAPLEHKCTRSALWPEGKPVLERNPEDGEGVTADQLNADAAKKVPITSSCDVRVRARAEAAILSSKPAAALRSTPPWDHQGKVEYYDRVRDALALTEAEQRKLAKDGMVVPARLEYDNYASAYYDVHRAQLPIFVSADSILHAIYASHDQLLARLEVGPLIERLDDALGRMHCALGAAAKDYPPEVAHDLDLYLVVARSLLADTEVAPEVDPAVAAEAQNVVGAIRFPNGLSTIELFGRSRAFDASAYEPRGHYANGMESYFRAAMWLSRMEWNLVSRDTRSSQPGYLPDPRETPREAVDALALADLADRSGALADFAAHDQAWAAFAGAREDVSLAELVALKKSAHIGKLTIPGSADALRAAIGAKYARTINTFPNPNVQHLPVIATALGPRITPDLGMIAALPRLEDPAEAGAAVAYALGQDRALAYVDQAAAAQLPDARAALATSGPHDDLYAAWLDAIRALAKPAAGKQASFASTTAYADLRMNSTLAAFGQLRHNHVLVSAQVYDVGGCEIPDGYVEPVPELYDALARWAKRGKQTFARLDPKDETKGAAYFARVEQLAGVLATIARHELANRPLTSDEKRFLAMAVEMREASAWNYNGPFPLPTYDGWYLDLFTDSDSAFHTAQFIIDYKTHDVNGVRWIDYLGAKGPRLGLFVVDTGGAPRLMAGPVAQAFAANGPLAKRFTDDTARDANAVMPWAASYTVAAVPAPEFAVASARAVPENPASRGGKGWNRTRRLQDLKIADGELAITTPKALGDVTVELRDHHFVKLREITVHTGDGRTVVKLPDTAGVESLLVHAGAYTLRVDYGLDGIAFQDSRSR